MSRPAEKLAFQEPQNLSIDELHDAWKELGDDEVVVDIRSPEDHGKARVPGSTNLPFPTVADRCEELRQYQRIYFYCYGGQGSRAVATRLAEMGFENVRFVGEAGMSDWESRGYPVANGS